MLEINYLRKIKNKNNFTYLPVTPFLGRNEKKISSLIENKISFKDIKK
jgi:hypothetical protein